MPSDRIRYIRNLFFFSFCLVIFITPFYDNMCNVAHVVVIYLCSALHLTLLSFKFLLQVLYMFCVLTVEFFCNRRTFTKNKNRLIPALLFPDIFCFC